MPLDKIRSCASSSKSQPEFTRFSRDRRFVSRQAHAPKHNAPGTQAQQVVAAFLPRQGAGETPSSNTGKKRKSPNKAPRPKPPGPRLTPREILATWVGENKKIGVQPSDQNRRLPHLTNHQMITLQKCGLCFYCLKRIETHHQNLVQDAQRCPEKANVHKFQWDPTIKLVDLDRI